VKLGGQPFRGPEDRETRDDYQGVARPTTPKRTTESESQEGERHEEQGGKCGAGRKYGEQQEFLRIKSCCMSPETWEVRSGSDEIRRGNSP